MNGLGLLPGDDRYRAWAGHQGRTLNPLCEICPTLSRSNLGRKGQVVIVVKGREVWHCPRCAAGPLRLMDRGKWGSR